MDNRLDAGLPQIGAPRGREFTFYKTIHASPNKRSKEVTEVSSQTGKITNHGLPSSTITDSSRSPHPRTDQYTSSVSTSNHQDSKVQSQREVVKLLQTLAFLLNRRNENTDNREKSPSKSQSSPLRGHIQQDDRMPPLSPKVNRNTFDMNLPRPRTSVPVPAPGHGPLTFVDYETRFQRHKQARTKKYCHLRSSHPEFYTSSASSCRSAPSRESPSRTRPVTSMGASSVHSNMSNVTNVSVRHGIVTGVDPPHREEPTRGDLYAVFMHLDKHQNGKVTFSQLEEAAIRLGCKTHQIENLFASLDSTGKGYVTISDWGNEEHNRKVTGFTRLYMRICPEMMQFNEIHSLEKALQLYMWKMRMTDRRGLNAERIGEAFRFVDYDKSGSCDKGELSDALHALGIHVSLDVVDKILERFDRDGDGTIDYYEFVKMLFPTTATAILVH